VLKLNHASSSKNHLIEYKIQSQYSVQTFARIEENCFKITFQQRSESGTRICNKNFNNSFKKTSINNKSD